MNTHIIENLRRGYGAFSRGDIQGAVAAIDPDPDILWSEPEDFYAVEPIADPRALPPISLSPNGIGSVKEPNAFRERSLSVLSTSPIFIAA